MTDIGFSDSAESIVPPNHSAPQDTIWHRYSPMERDRPGSLLSGPAFTLQHLRSAGDHIPDLFWPIYGPRNGIWRFTAGSGRPEC